MVEAKTWVSQCATSWSMCLETTESIFFLLIHFFLSYKDAPAWKNPYSNYVMKENQLKKSLSTAKGNHWYDWLRTCHLPGTVLSSGSATEVKNKFSLPIQKLCKFTKQTNKKTTTKKPQTSLFSDKAFKVKHWQVLDSPKFLHCCFPGRRQRWSTRFLHPPNTGSSWRSWRAVSIKDKS